MSQGNAPASWQDAVTDRIDDTTLIALTNPSKETQASSPSIDTDRLEAAIDDARGEFTVRTGLEPTLTDFSHVGCIVLGVIAYLKSYKAVLDEDSETAMFRFMGKCDKIRNILPIAAKNDSALTKSDEVPAGRTIRPDSDRSNFDRYLPRANFGSSFRRLEGL